MLLASTGSGVIPTALRDARAPPPPLGPDSQPQKVPVLPRRTGVGGLHPCSKDFPSHACKTGVSLARFGMMGSWGVVASTAQQCLCTHMSPACPRATVSLTQGDAGPCDEQLPPLPLPAGGDTPSSKLTSVLVLKTHAFFFVMKRGGQ